MGLETYRIGLIGLGTVGAGVLELLQRRRDDLARRLGQTIEVVAVAVRDPKKPRGLPLAGLASECLTADADALVSDPRIELLVEVAGGVDEPRRWILGALRQGKDVVTANKAVLALHGREIFSAAAESGRRVFYEASVAGAIPIIEMLQNGLIANQVTRLSAILNGTCNYILTRMEVDGIDFPAALKLAQEKGFAEADPSLDISGGDSAHKLALLAGIVMRAPVPLSAIYTEGIDRISSEDLSFARGLGFRLKLLGTLRLDPQGSWELRVHPTLIPRGEIISQVDNEFNAVQVQGDACGPMLIYGKGAGSLPTASSVVADVLRAARGDGGGGSPYLTDTPQLVPMGSVQLRHYMRLRVRDNPGVLGRITSHLGLRGISIASMQQPEAKAGHPVSIVLVTHTCADEVVTRALQELESVGLVEGQPTRIRIDQ